MPFFRLLLILFVALCVQSPAIAESNRLDEIIARGVLRVGTTGDYKPFSFRPGASEPFVGLDPKAAHTLKGLLRELCDGGSAIFFSTHVLEVAEKLCNKIAIIKNGRLIKAGNMDEVKGDDSLEALFLELTEHA